MVQRITEFVLKKPLLVMMILLLITGFFTYFIVEKARIETNLDKYMPEDHPAFKKSNYYEDVFNIDDAIIVAVSNKEGIYNQHTLQKINDITEEIQKLKGINPADVRSITTADNITGSDFGLEVEPFMKGIPETENEIKNLRKKVDDNEMIRGRFISTDNQSALIMAELKDDSIDRMALYNRVKEVLKGKEGPEEIYVAGQPVVEGTLASLMPRDMKKMVPIVILVIVIVLMLTFGNLKSTLLTLGVVLFSTIWAFGLMSFLGIPVYSVSTMIPVMLIALGVADGIHLLSHLQQRIRNEPELGQKEAIKDMVDQLWKPVVMTSVTTAVGFISLLTSEVFPIKYFGLFTAFGVMAAMVFSLFFIPAGLQILNLPANRKRKASKQGNFFYNLADLVTGHKRVIFVISVIIVILSLVGLQRVGIDSSLLSKFARDEEIIQANNFINEHFAGTTNLNVIIEADQDNELKNPEYLETVQKLQDELKVMPGVGDTFAVTDFLRRINKVMNENDEQYNRIPGSRELVAQYLLLYSMSGDPEELNRVIDYNYRRLNLRVNLKSDNARLIRKTIEKIDEFAAASNIADFKIDYAGSAYTNMVFTDLILIGQVKSLVISLIGVVILLGLLFRSTVAGILGSLPIAITAVINFGVMGILNISLNTTTALISSIVVGMGIDYSIHLLSKYRRYGQLGLDKMETARKTMNQSGRAIAFNALVVISGFLVLLFSSFPPNRELGWLVSLSMFNSFLLTLTLVVALIDKYQPDFIFGKRGKLNN